ncbi:hypothetical protein TcYC6_0034370 [Trypanosoma cruzi]|nr:hypothetical protein TcYC6_0034370 [Trypanosoma cruzi]
MRAFPESLSTSGAHTIIGIRRAARLNLPLAVWLCGRARALEAERDPADRFMDFGRTLLQAFRTQLMTASDPNTPLSKQRARLRTAVHEADAFARAAQPLAERGGAQRPCDVSGVAFVGARRPHAKPEARPEGINCDADGRQQRRRPHPCRHHQPFRTGAAPNLHPIFQIARRNRREGRGGLLANGARLWRDGAPAPRFGPAS